MGVPSILQEITDRRRGRISAEGLSLGARVPDERRVPLRPFPGGGIICEIKRRSPSRGFIGSIADPVEQAGLYKARGVGAVSVLTEGDYFGGTLDDLIEVKEADPDLAVLRKDFLQDPAEVELSYRAGADAVLLIAAVLPPEVMELMLAEAERLGMAALLEVHNHAELEAVRIFEPGLLGMNSRDLHSFTVDRSVPLRLAAEVDWGAELVFESGIRHGEDVRLAREAGFSAVLVGETAVAHPERIPELVRAARADTATKPERFFWRRLYAGRSSGSSDRTAPLVKICGITNRADAEAAVDAGAALLGFIFAESPRRISPELLRDLADLPVAKVAVVVGRGAASSSAEAPDAAIPQELSALLRDGFIDAVQLHGEERPDECASMAFPYYKALRIRSRDDVEAIRRYRSPRVLIDAFSADAYGGSGRRIPADVAADAAALQPLWLAGGLTPENIGDVVARFAPELVDVSSGVEAEPGRKDHDALRRFMEAARNADTYTGLRPEGA